MTDQYIRKAVELADGWFVGDTGFLCAPGLANVPLHLIDQCRKDALAAQLVRQVDALSEKQWPEVLIYHDCTKIHDGIVMRWVVEGTDRTMNTICAIVDSGVLEGQ